MAYSGIITDTVSFNGHKGEKSEGYYARPAGSEKVPGVVVLMHMRKTRSP